MVSIKNVQSLHLFILGKIGQHNVFHDILEKKNTFLDYKNNMLKEVINRDFSKGDSP